MQEGEIFLESKIYRAGYLDKALFKQVFKWDV